MTRAAATSSARARKRPQRVTRAHARTASPLRIALLLALRIALLLALWGLIACGERERAAPSAVAAESDTPRSAIPAGDEKSESGNATPAADARAGDTASEAEEAVPPPLFPRGLVAKRPGVAAGYVLFSPLLSGSSYLVNNDGEVVHAWDTPYSPGGGQHLLPNGNLLRTGRDPDQLGFRAGGTGGIVQEIDWDGAVVWEWRLSDATQVQHHDVEPLPNGNLLVLAWEVKTADDARRAGRRAERIPEQGLWPDWLLEVEPLRPSGAKIVWEWHSWDHLVQNHDPAAENYGDPVAHPGRLDVNAGAGAPEISPDELAQLQALGYVPDDATPEDLDSDFLHTNAVRYHPRLDQIALSVPELGEIWIIDHATTTEQARGPRGDLLYRWGNPAIYARGGADAQRLFGQHDVRWIPDGWEGAGNLTLFNNGDGRPAGSFSSVDEWTPPLGRDGRYTIADGEPYGPAQLHWQYVAPTPSDFFSPFISSAERLANGNTLICSGVGGQFFEVTRAGEIVWEYRNPFSGKVRNRDGTMPQPGLDKRPYAVFRATRIAEDHPALAQRRLGALDPQPAWFDTAAEAGGAAR